MVAADPPLVESGPPSGGIAQNRMIASRLLKLVPTRSHLGHCPTARSRFKSLRQDGRAIVGSLCSQKTDGGQPAASGELTREDGAEFGPAGDPSFRGVLAQRHFQEEDRQASPNKEDEVRDEEGT